MFSSVQVQALLFPLLPAQVPMVMPPPTPPPPALLNPAIGSRPFREGEEILLGSGARPIMTRDGLIYQVDRGPVQGFFRWNQATGQWQRGGAETDGVRTWAAADAAPFSAAGLTTANHASIDQLGAVLGTAHGAGPRHADYAALLGRFETRQACESVLGARFQRVQLRNGGGDVYVVRHEGQELWIRWNGQTGACEYGVCQPNGADPGPATWTPITTAPGAPFRFNVPDPAPGDPTRVRAVDVNQGLQDLLAATRPKIAQVMDPTTRAAALQASDADRAMMTFLTISGTQLPENRVQMVWRLPNTPPNFQVRFDRVSGNFQYTTNGTAWTNIQAGTNPFAGPANANPDPTAVPVLLDRQRQVANHWVSTIAGGAGSLPYTPDHLRAIGYAEQLAKANGGRLFISNNGTPMISMELSSGDTLYIALTRRDGRIVPTYAINSPNTPTSFRPLADFATSVWGNESRRGIPQVLHAQIAVAAIGRMFPTTGDVPSIGDISSDARGALAEIHLNRRFHTAMAQLIVNPPAGVTVTRMNPDDRSSLPYYQVTFTAQIPPQTAPVTRTNYFRIATEGSGADYRPVVQWFDYSLTTPRWRRVGENPHTQTDPQALFMNQFAGQLAALNNR